MAEEQKQNETVRNSVGVIQDIKDRFTRKDKNARFAFAACCFAAAQIFIGVSGGTFLMSVMMINFAFIGWLLNTAYKCWRERQGSGLILLSGIAFVLQLIWVFMLVHAATNVELVVF